VALSLGSVYIFASNVAVLSNLCITQKLDRKISLEWKWQNGFEKCSWGPEKNVDKDGMDCKKKG